MKQINQRGVIYLSVIVIIIFAVAVGSFFAGKYFQSHSSLVVAPSVMPVVTNIPQITQESGISNIPSATLNPQSTPISKKQSIEIKQEGNLKTYKDNNRKFSFSFGNSLSFNTSIQDEMFAQFLEFQPGIGNAARMVMQIFPNPQNSSLEEVIKRENLLSYNPLGPKYEYFKIQGREAVKLTKVMTQTELCNDGEGTTKNRIFYFLVKGEGFVVEIHPNETCDSFKKDWFEIVPSSFRFL